MNTYRNTNVRLYTHLSSIGETDCWRIRKSKAEFYQAI